jgi:hypothetical protein
MTDTIASGLARLGQERCGSCRPEGRRAFADNEEPDRIVGGPKVVIPSRKGRKAAAVTPWRCQRLGDVRFLPGVASIRALLLQTCGSGYVVRVIPYPRIAGHHPC